LLYKLTSSHTSNVSYLMGTMHVADNRAFAFESQACELMKQCSVYIGEMDLGTVDAQIVQEAFNLDEAQKYSSVFSPKKFLKYSKILKKSFDIDLINHDNIAPIFLQSIIASTLLGNERKQSLDQYLYTKAISFDLLTKGLETSEEQYHIAKNLDITIQMKQFTSLCRNPSKFAKQLNHLCNLYQIGDDTQLYLSSKKSLGSFRKIMLNQRNPIMAERIIEHTSKQACFISMGAGHLKGNIGVIALLKRNGVKVKSLIPKLS
jgi:uncharacterized protein